MRRYLARNHLGLLALFFALGGTSYAAFSLPANSVTTREVKNHSLLRKDFARGQARRGKPGPRGLAGLTGDQGATGPKGSVGRKGVTGPRGPQVAPPDWHEVAPSEFGMNQCPEFTSQWSNAGGSGGTVAYYRDPAGVVHLKGSAARSGLCATPPVFVLPAEDRPASDQIFAAWFSIPGGGSTPDGPYRVDILANGEVHAQDVDSFTLTVSLDGISFRAGS